MKATLFLEALKASLRNLAIVAGGAFVVFCITMALDMITLFFGGSGTLITNALFESLFSLFVDHPSKTAAALFVGVTFPLFLQSK